jgi:hypothetical protein
MDKYLCLFLARVSAGAGAAHNLMSHALDIMSSIFSKKENSLFLTRLSDSAFQPKHGPAKAGLETRFASAPR